MSHALTSNRSNYSYTLDRFCKLYSRYGDRVVARRFENVLKSDPEGLMAAVAEDFRGVFDQKMLVEVFVGRIFYLLSHQENELVAKILRLASVRWSDSHIEIKALKSILEPFMPPDS
jgi:hypothetical protein